ncbi:MULTISPECIES: 3-keto-disaccharide hydrolase [Proteiniphilum]|jgi:hypothetical protein|uniref:3-keto-disaccharide hydrolase n=1 Tax=Proteiniphilum TaxID=294702 RepID=UPI000EEC99C8|nr:MULTISPECIES: DUF1080 domain-containing protein [Proteiniphilum]MDD4778825.1 DUF1080 domain-containing protein [Fermentimonas sp.]ULB34118.1 DUF1080 domain-containing protein [Proteiniphilum propionicum]HCF80534.1 DUF1080 domain-containing protein [Porphyromonadaceae bacterium]
MKQYLLIALLVITTGCSSINLRGNRDRFSLSAEEKKAGYEILFDGKDMLRWTSNTDEYKLEDGCIVMQPADGHGNLYTKKEYDNFILRFEFLLTPEANSGLGLRHKMITTKSGYDGMELQILDNSAPIYANLKPYQYHGSLYGWVPAKRGYLKPAGEWNYQEVIAEGSKIKIILNGTTILDTDIQEAVKDVPENKIPKSLLYKKGHIAFLGHNSVVKFRNIRIKELD